MQHFRNHNCEKFHPGQPLSTVSQLQAEVENLGLRLFYMQGLSEGVRSDLTTMKNSSRKAQAEKRQAEEEKQKQVGLALTAAPMAAGQPWPLFLSDRIWVTEIFPVCSCFLRTCMWSG